MADIFTFDTSEFELLETIDFEEEIQRPQSMRFFTLEDQLVDFFEKSLPPGKPTTFEKKEIQYAQQRLKTVYNRNIAFSESDYILDTNRKSVNAPWIHEVYSDFDYKPYSLTKSYVPLLDKGVRTTPNYYPRLITALPRPYTSTEEGRTLREKKTLVNTEGLSPITGLGDYVKTRTVINEDGTYDIRNETVQHTGDDLKIKGFYLETKKFELPNPLQEHPFLKSTASAFIESDIPLLTMYPTIESIMEHAIPTTRDPYNEGNKFFKYYDVNISDIPWKTWKQKFPPVETKESPKYPETIVFPNKSVDEPSEILLKTYSNIRTPGQHPRLWLTTQVDSGSFVGKLLVSASSENGVISTPPTIAPPEADHPAAHSDVCTNLTQDFDSFLSSGLYRHTKYDKGIPTEGVCVPVGKIQQEKLKHFSEKKLWKESEEQTIKTAYVKLLSMFQKVGKKEVIEKYEKAAHQKESERRKDVLTVLNDPHRTPDDRLRAIEMLLRDCHMLNNIYLDIDSIFVICSHSMEILRGKMEEDPSGFLREWTTVIDGSRICRYCNEEVSAEVLVDTDEYDEDGYYIESSSKMEVVTASAPNSFFQIRSLFDLKHGGESLMFLILSLLQTLPQETQLLPVLHLIRKITASLKARASQKALSQKDQDRVEGVLGICGTIILLQTHSPFLVPSRFIKVSGYPRDSADVKDSPILESIVMFMKKTFAGFPVMIEGSMRIIAGDLLARPFKVSEEAQRYLPVFASQFNTLLESARERYTMPTEELNTNSIKFPLMKVDNSVFNTSDTVGDELTLECNRYTLMTSYMSKLPPTVRQIPIKLTKILKTETTNVAYVEKPTVLLKFVKKDVEANISKGMPTGFKEITEFVNSVNDACSFSTITSRFLDIVSKTKFSKEKLAEFRKNLVFMNVSESPSIMRDSAKGILFKFMNEIKGQPELVRLVNDGIKNDLTLRILLTSKKGAEKEELKLRTQEKNLVKSRYREMNDTEREVVKMLADIGQSEFIVTNIDREIFAKEFERETLEMEDVDRPEEGYDDARDYVENGDQPLAADGTILEVDRGNYGDRGVRDYNDYGNTVAFDD
jgi:hypothetical protein